MGMWNYSPPPGREKTYLGMFSLLRHPGPYLTLTLTLTLTLCCLSPQLLCVYMGMWNYFPLTLTLTIAAIQVRHGRIAWRAGQEHLQPKRS